MSKRERNAAGSVESAPSNVDSAGAVLILTALVSVAVKAPVAQKPNEGWRQVLKGETNPLLVTQLLLGLANRSRLREEAFVDQLGEHHLWSSATRAARDALLASLLAIGLRRGRRRGASLRRPSLASTRGFGRCRRFAGLLGPATCLQVILARLHDPIRRRPGALDGVDHRVG